MAEDAVRHYRAKSVVVSRTMWFNVAALVLTILGMTEFQTLLSDETVALISGLVIPAGNMVLRFYSVRPVALLDSDGSMLTASQSVPVSVEKL